MIIHSYDDRSPAIINPRPNPDNPSLDACILTFSHKIADYVRDNYPCREIARIHTANGPTPIDLIEREGPRIGFFMTHVGAPVCAGDIEDTISVLNLRRFVVFGGAGCLDRSIPRGTVMIPTEAYRDEGTSYHYAPPSDYIAIKNHAVVEAFMARRGVAHVAGRTWTTDAFYRETRDNFERRRADGCISVEMEVSAIQAVCDHRGLDYYSFLTSGDLLDAPVWDSRLFDGEVAGSQHDRNHFDLAYALARAVCS